jgi:hypothetical protein
MSPNPPSPATQQEKTTRPWLQKHYEARRQRTIQLVKATIDRLLADGQVITLEAICTRSPEVDPEGRGVKKAGILGNEEAHAYYRKHSVTYQSGRGQQQRKGTVSVSTHPSRLHPDRDIGRVRQRYLQQTKQDLVERLLAVEQEWITCQNQVARLQFALLDLQQRVEEAERKAPSSSSSKGSKKSHTTSVHRAIGESQHET